ncbi:MAG TPA: hypothetical protein VIJ68_02050 [Candidatus Saccharimonadales bacterium]
MPTTLTPKDYVTADDLQKFGMDLSKRIVDDIAEVLQAYMTHVDERFNKVESRLGKLETSSDILQAGSNKLEAGQLYLTKAVNTLLKA